MRKVRRPIALLAGLTVAMAGAVLVVPAAAATAPTISVVNGETQPIYSYQDAIRETVYIEAQMDSDSDGKPDRIAADVMRPKETNTGLKAATVMEASPYYGLGTFAALGGGDQQYIPGAPPRGFSRWYDEYFVPRGYAVVEVEMQGTSRSDGCPTTGAHEDTVSIQASVEWLNGRAKAYYADGKPAVASWSTGSVGMLGVSYNGTLPNALAAAGTPGLKTIVPIAAISSWYDYTRDQGIGYQGAWGKRYPEYLANYVASRAAKAECAQQIKALGDKADDVTYNQTPFWDARDYRLNTSQVKASVLVVHGMEDWNVKPANFSRWWYGLQERGVPRKIWLHRGGHSDPIGFRKAEWERTMHHWMDYWLLGIPNNIMNEPMAAIERPDGKWEQHASWPDAKVVNTKLHLGPAGGGSAGTLNPQPAPAAAIQTFADNRTQTEATAAGDPAVAKANRLVYVTSPLTKAARLSGTAKLTVTATPDSASTPLTALLVDYGAATRTSVSDKTPAQLMTESCEASDLANRTGCAAPPVETTAATPYKVITRGAIDVKNAKSLKEEQKLVPGKSYEVRWELHPKDYVFPAGHQIGVVLVANLSSYITPDTAAGKIQVSLQPSSLDLPIVGGL